MMKKLLIIDGQGGKIGSQLITALKERENLQITAVGTNAMATAAMLKAGASLAATGENPVIVGCRDADVILGPIGIVMADALLGEVTPKMAQAVASCPAHKILIPFNRCGCQVAGVGAASMNTLLSDALRLLDEYLNP
jgi:dihydrodipicolinate reductase